MAPAADADRHLHPPVGSLSHGAPQLHVVRQETVQREDEDARAVTLQPVEELKNALGSGAAESLTRDQIGPPCAAGAAHVTRPQEVTVGSVRVRKRWGVVPANVGRSHTFPVLGIGDLIFPAAEVGGEGASANGMADRLVTPVRAVGGEIAAFSGIDAVPVAALELTSGARCECHGGSAVGGGAGSGGRRGGRGTHVASRRERDIIDGDVAEVTHTDHSLKDGLEGEGSIEGHLAAQPPVAVVQEHRRVLDFVAWSVTAVDVQSTGMWAVHVIEIPHCALAALLGGRQTVSQVRLVIPQARRGGLDVHVVTGRGVGGVVLGGAGAHSRRGALVTRPVETVIRQLDKAAQTLLKVDPQVLVTLVGRFIGAVAAVRLQVAQLVLRNALTVAALEVTCRVTGGRNVCRLEAAVLEGKVVNGNVTIPVSLDVEYQLELGGTRRQKSCSIVPDIHAGVAVWHFPDQPVLTAIPHVQVDVADAVTVKHVPEGEGTGGPSAVEQWGHQARVGQLELAGRDGDHGEMTGSCTRLVVSVRCAWSTGGWQSPVGCIPDRLIGPLAQVAILVIASVRAASFIHAVGAVRVKVADDGVGSASGATHELAGRTQTAARGESRGQSLTQGQLTAGGEAQVIQPDIAVVGGSGSAFNNQAEVASAGHADHGFTPAVALLSAQWEQQASESCLWRFHVDVEGVDVSAQHVVEEAEATHPFTRRLEDGALDSCGIIRPPGWGAVYVKVRPSLVAECVVSVWPCARVGCGAALPRPVKDISLVLDPVAHVLLKVAAHVGGAALFVRIVAAIVGKVTDHGLVYAHPRAAAELVGCTGCLFEAQGTLWAEGDVIDGNVPFYAQVHVLEHQSVAGWMGA